MEDFLSSVPSVDPAAMSNLHPLDAIEQLRSAMMPTPASTRVPTVPTSPAAPQGDGWRSILQMLAPVIGGLAMGGGAKQTGFLNGYSQGQELVKQDREQKAQDAQKRAAIASDYVAKITDQADQITDPNAWSHFVDTADAAAARAKLTQPGEIKNQLTFPRNKLAAKQLSELTDQLSGFEKQGYNLDELAQGGSVIQLKDGTHVPVKTAMDVIQARPLDAKGKPVAKPAKAASTAEERYIAQWAKENHVNVSDLTTDQIDTVRKKYASDKPGSVGTLDERAAALLGDIEAAKVKGDTATATAKKAEYDRIVQAKKDLNGASRNPQMDEINLSLKQLQLENEKRKAKEAGQAVDIQPGSPYYKYAEDLASGDLTFSQFNRMITTRGAGGQNVNALKASLYGKASELNPNFSPAAFEMGYKFASSPKVMAQIASVNNVLSGVPDLLRASDDAKRLGATTLNGFVMKGGIAIGKQKYSDFKTAQTAFADELSGALGYGSATDMSREMGFSMTDPNLSPDNFRSAVERIVVPFVKRKKISMQGQMGPYGQDRAPDSAPNRVYYDANGNQKK